MTTPANYTTFLTSPSSSQILNFVTVLSLSSASLTPFKWPYVTYYHKPSDLPVLTLFIGGPKPQASPIGNTAPALVSLCVGRNLHARRLDSARLEYVKHWPATPIPVSFVLPLFAQRGPACWHALFVWQAGGGSKNNREVEQHERETEKKVYCWWIGNSIGDEEPS